VPTICQNEEVDWEVELCVVIGSDCKDVGESDAMDHVLGYCVANDVSPSCSVVGERGRGRY
jgi:2-keto-4-pentenoate hydratase/2-oxohepta-3-ene-1,7-dioic acid hydratase in catechol pathway